MLYLSQLKNESNGKWYRISFFHLFVAKINKNKLIILLRIKAKKLK
jgi:hypothetical protein